MFAYQSSGARAAGVGMSGIAMSGDAFASLINPSLLVECHGTSLILGYDEVFNSNLTHNSLGLVSKVLKQPISILYDCLSAQDIAYQESKLQLGLGRSVGNFALGLNAKFYNISSIETATGFGADLGFLWQVRPNFTVGMLLKDLLSELNLSTGSEELLFMQAEAGCALNIPQLGTFFLQAGEGLRIGFEKWYSTNVALRGGLDDGNMTVGMSLVKKPWQIDYVFNTHLMGGTHQLSVTIRL
jgi:hypothetical protein